MEIIWERVHTWVLSCILQSATEAEETQPVIPELSAPVNKQDDGMLICLGVL